MDEKPKRQISIELGEREAEGLYANMAMITHSPSEFIIDFARLMPGAPKSKVQARIIMTPQNLKSFHLALRDNIAKYEVQYGTIPQFGKEEKNIGFHRDSPPGAVDGDS
ncbi:MAG: hypothetical protein A2Z06_00030 [Candidatus Glassbacteria bacterium RBG_16_58_8]|uniref:Transcriptional accessory protein n=1 Tax=Candidatus Glassbacteria bacterium RBG_16_58_8 TaxID=1817866 RepID=A0A1F5YCR2_9BACT|nr:MAG: hypothetical protein A2Z06_00030 [Candidatus Glassbacteria bacterium RBG_16_58_8]